MKFIKSKRGFLLLATLVVAGAAAFGAYAYWTSTGTGTATAPTGTVAGISVNDDSGLTAMYPGDSPQPLSGTFTNTNSGPVYVATVTASIDSVDQTTAGALAGSCDSSDYTLTGPIMAVGHEVAAGTDVDSWGGASIHFNDKSGTNQNGCQGATVNLLYTVG